MGKLLQVEAEVTEDKKDTKKEAGYYLPLRRMAEHVLIVGACDDCGTERTQSVGHYMKSGVSPLTTVDTLNKVEKCQRMGCGGEMRFRINMED